MIYCVSLFYMSVKSLLIPDRSVTFDLCVDTPNHLDTLLLCSLQTACRRENAAWRRNDTKWLVWSRVFILSCCAVGPAHHGVSSLCLPAAAIMSSVLQKLISPLASSPAEPPRNKVTVVGVGQVGMACAVSILLRVRHNDTFGTTFFLQIEMCKSHMWYIVHVIECFSPVSNSHIYGLYHIYLKT